MAKRKRDMQLNFRVSAEELAVIYIVGSSVLLQLPMFSRIGS